MATLVPEKILQQKADKIVFELRNSLVKKISLPFSTPRASMTCRRNMCF